MEQILLERCGAKCELCAGTENLNALPVPPDADGASDRHVMLCFICTAQVNQESTMDPNHWRCLNDSMWSEVPVVQVLAWRLLRRLNQESWARDLTDMLYLDEATLAWAEAISEEMEETVAVYHVDSNGSALQAGDTVTLIKDLVVKGGGFTAKRGTAVRGIALVADNAEHIEGRVNGQKIVILTQFVKKSS
ncbi:MAG: PhnA protein [Planctomycetota bacterium]|nr:MAG: PhnA protein [Planctomycetota bacterium]